MAYIKEYWQNKEQRAETARKHTKEMQNKYGRCIQLQFWVQKFMIQIL